MKKLEIDIFEVKTILNLIDTIKVEDLGIGIEELCLEETCRNYLKELEEEENKKEVKRKYGSRRK